LIVLFAALWIFFETSIPKEQILGTVKRLEKAVSSEDWDKAKRSMSQLESQWKKSKFLVQMANGSEEVLVARDTLGEIKTMVKEEDDDVIEHIGRLQSALESITVAFPGP